MPTPPIRFSPWVPWTERAFIPGSSDHGVYLLAHFGRRTVPKGPASPLDKHIVYIGETHKQALLKRWRNFATSAKRGAKGHAGGRTYYRRYEKLRGDLFVAAYVPPHVYTPRQRTFLILLVEAKLVWEFSHAHRRDSLCNKH